MRTCRYSQLFRKELKKVGGKELQNILRKRDEILAADSLDRYKNLTKDLKKFKRVHVNTSYIILFFGDDGTVYFVDYAHHDTVYRHSRKHLKRYQSLEF